MLPTGRFEGLVERRPTGGILDDDDGDKEVLDRGT